MQISEKYRKYRKASIELNKKITTGKIFRNIILDDAVNLLGFDKEGKTVIFDSEFEMDVLSDFLMFESMKEQKRPIDIYQEEYSAESEIEKEILEALVNAKASLFKIESVDKENNVIWLSDILNGGQKIRLVDIGLSGSAEAGFLIFTRLLFFEDFCMTSGVSFIFNSNLEKYILRRHRKIMKKHKSENESLKKFVAFFRLNKECGMEIMNKEI